MNPVLVRVVLGIVMWGIQVSKPVRLGVNDDDVSVFVVAIQVVPLRADAPRSLQSTSMESVFIAVTFALFAGAGANFIAIVRDVSPHLPLDDRYALRAGGPPFASPEPRVPHPLPRAFCAAKGGNTTSSYRHTRSNVTPARGLRPA